MGKNIKLKTTCTLLTLAGISLVGLGRPANATDTSLGLFDTGVSSVGTPLTPPASDTAHYTIFRVPYSSVTTGASANNNPQLLTSNTPASTCNITQPGNCAGQSLFDKVYLNNGTTDTSGTTLGLTYTGTYIFKTTFTVPVNQTVTYISGLWAAYPGSTGVSITLNPTATGTSIFNNAITGGTTVASTPSALLPLSGFAFSNGINQSNVNGGLNTLYFKVNYNTQISGVTSAGLQVNSLNQRVPVPFEFDAKEGFLLGIPLFIGLRRLKKKRASAAA